MAVEVDIVDRATALAELSLGVLSERIEQSGDTMPLRALIDTTAMALKALGFGPGKTPSPASVQVNVADPELLERARERMRQLSRARDEGREPAPVLASDR